jgi:hypothetical protein
MNSQEIQAEIPPLEKRRDALKERLDQLIKQFQDELPTVAEPWIRREVESSVAAHPDAVVALGPAGVKSFKEKVNLVIAGLPALTQEVTSNPGDWPHNRPYSVGDYGRRSDESFLRRPSAT